MEKPAESSCEDITTIGSNHNEHGSAIREQKFTFWALCGIALSTGESWVALGNSLALSIYNGGSAGVLYGFIADSACYWVVAASIAELASSMPNTATVYHWARITGGRRGQAWSWYAGWWSFAAWQVAVASLVSFMAMQVLGMYGVTHPDFVIERWHITTAYLVCNSAMCLAVLFGDRWLSRVESLGLLLTTGGWLVSIMICAIMPSMNGNGYATSSNVWTGWQNRTGWSSDGFVFCLGMLNAAFAVCAPDIPAHLSEEVPNARRNVPLVILTQYIASFITGLAFLVTLFYANPDLDGVLSQRTVFPLSALYLQATSPSVTVGLLVLCFFNTAMGVLGVFALAGRQAWALARANETPFPGYFGVLDEETQAPFRAIAFVGVMSSGLGLLYLASETIFNAITGSFVVFLSLAYLGALIPHLLSGRKNVPRGPFWMPGPIGAVVNLFAVGYLITFGVIFCFPTELPVTGSNMNYTVIIVASWTILATVWRLVKPSHFKDTTPSSPVFE